MRLICPSCRAQYEVDDDAIPANGRDVQCSSCSTTWFQPHALTLTGAIPAPVAESSKPVFRHNPPAVEEIPAPQPMPDDKPADREKLLREIRAEAEQEASLDAGARIEREPPAETQAVLPASVVEHAAAVTTEPAPREAETDLDTADVHAYPEPVREVPVADPAAEEAFMQNLRDQIAQQSIQPEEFSRTTSVIAAAEKAGIALDKSNLPPPAAEPETNRTESLQRTIRDLSSTPEEAPRRRSYSVGAYLAAILFLLALAAYLLRAEISTYYPPAAPWLELYAGYVDQFRNLVQDLWVWSRDKVSGLMNGSAPAS
jgi:predicted Zn finger-like uncharacterized protein